MQTPEGFTQEAYSWMNMAKVITDSLADSWFEHLGPVPISSSLSRNELGDKSVLQYFMPFFFGEEETKVLPTPFKDFSDLGEPVVLDESPLGKKLIKLLKQEGVTWDFKEERLPLTEFEGVLLPSLKHEGRGQWGTFFGMPYDQSFRIYKSRKSGKEVILWGADILAATRPFEHLTVRYGYDEQTNERYMIRNDEKKIAAGGITFGQWSTRIFIPALLKRLFYLGETPFPSNILDFPRTMAYGEEFPESLFPNPYFMHKKKSRVSGAYDENREGFLTSAANLTDVIEAGWLIQDMAEDQLSKCVSVASNGLTKMLTILEDGYLNHNTNLSQVIWDEALGSGVTLDEHCEYGGNSLGLSTWIPVPRIGIALYDTYERAPEALRDDNFAELEDISFNGVGPLVANCINSFVFSHLIDTEFHYMIDRLLESAYLMDVGSESTNALSNWGIAYYKRGEFELAKAKFLLALEREDKYSEAEASWWLTKIFEMEGNTKKAKVYRDRCQIAGGYNPDTGEGDQTAMTLSGSENSKVEGSAKFCFNCGEPFVEAGKFCTNCGSKRN
jgi:tetratricopeptide (TPR) repeat protein